MDVLAENINVGIECQLATSQLGRYLGGEYLSAHILNKLEAHISTCANCQRLIAKRREALQNIINAEINDMPHTESKRPYIDGVKNSALKGSGKAILLDFLSKKQAIVFEQEEIKASIPIHHHPIQETSANASQQFKSIPIPSSPWIKNWRPITVAITLAIVMIIMGKVATDPTALLGKKVSQDIQAQKQLSKSTIKTINRSEKFDKVSSESYSESDLPADQIIQPSKEVLTHIDPASIKYEEANPNADYAMKILKNNLVDSPVKEASHTVKSQIIDNVSNEDYEIDAPPKEFKKSVLKVPKIKKAQSKPKRKIQPKRKSRRSNDKAIIKFYNLAGKTVA